MFSISFQPDDDGYWLVRCRELDVEILLHEPEEIIEAAELTGWQPTAAGRTYKGDHVIGEMVLNARTVLDKTVGREFPVPPVSTFSDRLWEAWLAARLIQ